MDLHAEYVATKDWQAAAEERKKKTAGELYDLEADPKEVHNLAGTLEYDSVVKQLREEVEKWQMETKDLRFKEFDYERDGIEILDGFDFDVDDPGLGYVEKSVKLH
ncbi:hypothetical protein E5D57_000289 [Metarhizium anisopliae]|nr:hypothetical protein E5D57_000289 [Metarhizium anisopliae]